MYPSWGLFSFQQRDQCWSAAVLSVYPAALNKIRDPALWLPILLSSWCLTTWRPTAHSHSIRLTLKSPRPLTYLFVMQAFCTSNTRRKNSYCVHESLKMRIKMQQKLLLDGFILMDNKKKLFIYNSYLMWFGKRWAVLSTQHQRKQQIFIKWIDRKPEVHQDSCYMYCCGICFSLKVVNTMFLLNIAWNYCHCLITIAKHRAKAIKPCYILHSSELPLFSIENSFPNSISMCFKMTYAPCHEQANRSRAMQGSSSDEFICSRSIKIKQQPTPPKNLAAHPQKKRPLSNSYKGQNNY